MDDTQILDRVKAEAFQVVDSLVNGGGEEIGVGESLSSSVSMTTATECYWGTSGRGNKNAAHRIRIVASLGFVKVAKVGRTERVSLTQSGLDLYRSNLYLRASTEGASDVS